MAKEIERKFLVDFQKLPPLSNPYSIKQGYISGCISATVRIRIRNEEAFLTLKGKTNGLSRSEFEYPVPLSDAKQMLEELCSTAVIEKKRYHLNYQGHLWEIDIFEGTNRGLIVAEIELSHEDETFLKPEWVTQEVSSDVRYRNSNLITHPYSLWQ